MIAQDFARVRVLGAFSRGVRGETPRTIKDGSIATPYGVATMCAHAGKVVRVREGESGRSQGGDDVPGATRAFGLAPVGVPWASRARGNRTR